MPAAEEVVEPAGEDQVEDEEYVVWKKNTPFLYDLVISHPLEWPSLTVQWLPTSESSSSSSASSLILGTHTSDEAQNFLMLATVDFPSDTNSNPGVRIKQTIPHRGEVNRARYMPQKPSVVATKTCGAEVHLFDCGSREAGEEGNGPDSVLRGHEKEGYGISWSGMKEGVLLSGSYDSKICLWDLGGNLIRDGGVAAKDVFEAHESAVEDVAWHWKNENLFGSVGDDHKLMIWDLRSSTPKSPVHSIVAHEKEVNSLTFNPFSEWILATASADTTINLFDLRKLTLSLHTFSSHTYVTLSSTRDEVLQVAWSPNHETIFASCAADKRLMVWDLSRIGDEQATEDAGDGPPELLFVHGGHTANISEFSWNPSKPWTISSVAEDNIVQIWQMADLIYNDDQ